MAFKHEAIARFPNVPEDKKHHVELDGHRKKVCNLNFPRSAERVALNGNVQAPPSLSSSIAVRENVLVSFKDAIAARAPGFF